MKVLHIIPSAFNYFDDIRREAFAWLEEENNFGLQSEVITLEYGTTTKKEESEVGVTAPSRQFLGQQPISENANSWDRYDIINLHCPFFGAASQIISWAQANPNKALVVTYHNDFRTPDFFSLIIKFYNLYYLPKVFSIAKAVCFLVNRRSQSRGGISTLKNDKKAFVLGQISDELDIHKTDIVSDLILVYNNTTLTNTN
ncbi:MAG: hypothetical protein NT034_01570 [Candidatus Magasanikbacteria bacterium]|nr:hypothetical protein [Candidatus Magasanikbacteria bacterium]